MPADTAALSAFTGGLLMATTAMPSTFVTCTRSLINFVSMVPYIRISGEGNSRFLRNNAKLLHHRQDQRHAFLAAQSLRFTFGIAWNQRAVRSRSRLAGAESANEIVDLKL